MKVEGWLFLGCGIFFGGADIVYWYLSKDPTGTTALALAVGLAVLTGFYVLFTGRRLPSARKTTRRARSRRAPARSASSARTAGGRCSSACPPRGGRGPRDRLVAVPDRALFTVFATIGFVFEYYRGHFAH